MSDQPAKPYEWACIEGDPTTWGYGVVKDDRIEPMEAIVLRQDDGSWAWAVWPTDDKRSSARGSAPFADLARQEAERMLEEVTKND